MELTYWMMDWHQVERFNTLACRRNEVKCALVCVKKPFAGIIQLLLSDSRSDNWIRSHGT